MPLTIQSKRRGTSIYFGVTLSDSQVVVNWTDLDIKDVFMYSEAQRSYAGRCTYEIDSEDPSKLHVTYPADKQQYLGLHRLVVRVILEGTEATYDAPAINLVASMEQAATPVVSEEVAIGIEITEVDTTIMHEILRACQQATDAANAAVAEAEQAIEDAEAATTAANAAAALANEKASAAQSAATAATNAAALANEKAALANEAAAAAQQAKTAADEAAAAALEAKEAADESAENADAKAALAQQAANSANTAATLAENRATEAHEAAAAATVAKNAANTAAAAAQSAATEATSAADEASAKAILASDAAQTATQAATLANTKAGEAGNAAAAANTAASAATTAASSATSAASAATTAAGSATTAAESANAAAELANEAASAAQAAADTVEAFIANFEHAYLEGQRVGVADNIAPQGEGSEVEFTSRALTDVEANSVAMFPKIMGKSLVVEGAIVNNKVEKVVSTGIQLWDEQWEVGELRYTDGAKVSNPNCIRSKNLSPIIGGKTYNLTKVNYTAVEVFIVAYDANKNYVDFWGFTSASRQVAIPDNIAYFGISFAPTYGTTYKHDICINISDPSINGQYFPYEEHTLDLSWIAEIKDENGVALFEDGMRSAMTFNDEASANKAVRRVIEIDLGDLTWIMRGSGENTWWDSADLASVLAVTGGTAESIQPIISSVYANEIWADIYNHNKEGIGIYHNEFSIVIYDSAKMTMTADEFKASVAGIKANVGIANPIVVEYPAQNLCVKQTTGGVMTVEAGTGQNTTPFRAMLVNGLNAFGRLMAIGKMSELQTTAKTVVGAINELLAMITNAAAQSTE